MIFITNIIKLIIIAIVAIVYSIGWIIVLIVLFVAVPIEEKYRLKRTQYIKIEDLP